MRLCVLLGHASRRRLEQLRLVSLHNMTSSSSCSSLQSSLLGVQPAATTSQDGDCDGAMGGESMVVDGASGAMTIYGDGSARVGGFRLVELEAIGLANGGSADVGSLFVEGICTRWGTVRSVYVQRRRNPGRRTRFGFVHMVSAVDACKTKAMLDGWQMGGSSLSVSVAKVPHPKRGVAHCVSHSMIDSVRVVSSGDGLDRKCDDGVVDEVTPQLSLVGEDDTGCDQSDVVDYAVKVVGSRLDSACVSSSACVSLREGSRVHSFHSCC